MNVNVFATKEKRVKKLHFDSNHGYCLGFEIEMIELGYRFMPVHRTVTYTHTHMKHIGECARERFLHSLCFEK